MCHKVFIVYHSEGATLLNGALLFDTSLAHWMKVVNASLLLNDHFRLHSSPL